MEVYRYLTIGTETINTTWTEEEEMIVDLDDDQLSFRIHYAYYSLLESGKVVMRCGVQDEDKGPSYIPDCLLTARIQGTDIGHVLQIMFILSPQ